MLPAGPKVFRSGGNPPSIRRNLLLCGQFRHVLRCGTTAQCQTTYQGGELRFPEYSRALYAPETGGAVVSPCALLHEALPGHPRPPLRRLHLRLRGDGRGRHGALRAEAPLSRGLRATNPEAVAAMANAAKMP